MPLKIACPKCKTQYQLPDSAMGKAVKCKSCGATFKSPAPAANQLAVSKKRELATAQQPSTSELAKFGIDGPIKKQADIFSAAPLNPKSNPLGNYIEDPGFADIASFEDELELEESADGMDAILNNPYARPTSVKKKSSSDSDANSTLKKRKKKKRKIHPAVKDSLDNATMTLLIIGVLTMMIFGFQYYNADHDTKALLNNLEVEELGWDTEEAAEVLSAGPKRTYLFGMGIGFIFVIFAFGVQIFPITCTILALVFYVGLEVMNCIMVPVLLIAPEAWLIRVVICGALGKAFMDALNARSYSQMMDARAAAKRGTA